MDSHPIETERLILRPPVAADAEAIYRNWASDPEVTRYLVWRPHQSVLESKAFIGAVQDGWTSGREYTWLICLKPGSGMVQEGAPIGSIALRLEKGKAGIGYALARKHWGFGYMPEAARKVVALALTDLTIQQVGAYVDVENTASARVLEKLGMSREDRLERWLVHPNVSDEPRDCYFYALMRPGWGTTRPAEPPARPEFMRPRR